MEKQYFKVEHFGPFFTFRTVQCISIQTTDMNWIGATFLLFFALQDIVFAKYFLVKTEDENAPPDEAALQKELEDYRLTLR